MALDNNQSETTETWRKRQTNEFVEINGVMHPFFCITEYSHALGDGNVFVVVADRLMEPTADKLIADHNAAQEAAKLREALEKIIDSQTMPAYEYSVKWGEVPTRPEQRARAALGVSDD